MCEFFVGLGGVAKSLGDFGANEFAEAFSELTRIILSKSGSMKQRMGLCSRDIGVTTSSVRVPVTEANREYLRALRQAELEAWRNAPGGTVCANRR